MNIPLLLEPKRLSLWNYWRQSAKTQATFTRDIVIIGFGLALMLGLYLGGQWVAEKAQAGRAYLYFHPSLALGLMLVYLFAMLVFSNAAAAVSSLFLSADLDLILSSPISASRFFWGKFCDVLLGSSWVTMLFILPVVYSFARYYHAPFSYYLYAIVVLVPYFAIPTALSLIAVTTYCRFVSATRTKEALAVLGGISLIGAYLLLTLLFNGEHQFSFKKTEDILRLVSLLTVPNVTWMPSYWATTCLAERLEPTKSSSLPYLMLLWSTAVASLAAAFLVIRAFHFTAYSHAFGGRVSKRRTDPWWSRIGARMLSRCSPASRALVMKDVSLFVRDAGQLFQLVLLGGLCLLYFYNFRLLHGLQEELAPQVKRWWSVFLFLTNTSIEAFLITAVGTRFVFQSVSLEGRSYWVIQTAPLTTRQFLQTKLWTWCVPIALILGTVFGIGSYSTGVPAPLIVLKVLSSWIICYGVVGLAVGMGAYFANFSWEHASQLAASFGTLVYMFVSVMLVALNLGTIVLMLVLEHYRTDTCLTTHWIYGAGEGLAAVVFVLLNVAVVRRSLQFGEAELQRRMQ